MRLEKQLVGVPNCPHCGIANPQLLQLWNSGEYVPNNTGEPPSRWAAYYCTSCGNVISGKGAPGSSAANAEIVELYPPSKTAHEDLPEAARSFLQQAYTTLHAPDAAAVMAGSAVDAMLKARRYSEGSLYSRIDQAVKDHVLTDAMGNWAHEVRLGSNRPRHADKDRPHVTPEEAKQSVEFAEALGYFLFVLTAQIERGIARAQGAPEEAAAG